MLYYKLFKWRGLLFMEELVKEKLDRLIDLFQQVSIAI